MKEKLTEAAINIFKVKSLITFSITGTVVYLAVKGTIEPKDVMLLASMVFTYFFTKKNDAQA
jgi:hypothetical protein